MGLPLFIAPVESDVAAKPAAKGLVSPAHTRSPIRRSDRRRQLHEIREHRLRMLAALQSDDDIPAPLAAARANNSRSVENPRVPEHPIPLLEDPVLSDLRNDILSRQRDRERQREREREREQREREQREREQREREGERERRDPIRSNPTFDIGSVYLEEIGGPSWGSGGLDLPTPATNASQRFRAWESNSFPFEPSSRLDSPGYLSLSMAARRTWAREQDRFRQQTARNPLERPRRRVSRDFHRPGHRVRYVDGLGDRDRSLSPEGDGVWDTLQSTLTPDPQPPSVGSSFASTTASAAASHSTNISSSNTSITSPEEAVEPPCDPIIGNSDSEDDGEDQQTEPSHRPPLHTRRSYADVLAEYGGDVPETRSQQSPEDSENPEGERLEWLSGMHRIVRGLAARQDIPDEWWAQAGLSRSMSWGEPN